MGESEPEARVVPCSPRVITHDVAPGIRADLSTTPAFAIECRAEWRRAAKALPEKVDVACLCSLEPSRSRALVFGDAVPSRAEAAVLDWALGCNASRHLPPPTSATMPQPRPDAHADFQKTIDSTVTPTTSTTKAKRSMAEIAHLAGLTYWRTYRILRRRALPSERERDALERVLGRA